MDSVEHIENVCHFESFILTMKSTLLAKTISEKGYALLAEKILFLNQKRLKDRCHAEMASITAQVSFLILDRIQKFLPLVNYFLKIQGKSQLMHSKAGRKMQDSLTMAAGKYPHIKMAIMKLNLKKMISQRKSAFKQYGEITEMNAVLQTELKEIKRTGFTNKDMLNTLLGPVNLIYDPNFSSVDPWRTEMTIYRGKAKCYFQLIQKYEAIIAENQAAFRLKLLEDTMPESLKLRSGQFPST